MAVTSNSKFSGNHLTWTVQRTDRTCRVHVVEPRNYEPSKHASIFEAAITALVSQPRALVDPFSKDVPALVDEPFDLITFPEAFLPVERLLAALGAFSALPSLGCV